MPGDYPHLAMEILQYVEAGCYDLANVFLLVSGGHSEGQEKITPSSIFLYQVKILGILKCRIQLDDIPMLEPDLNLGFSFYLDPRTWQVGNNLKCCMGISQ